MLALSGSIGIAYAIELFTSGFMLGLSAYAVTKEAKEMNKP